MIFIVPTLCFSQTTEQQLADVINTSMTLEKNTTYLVPDVIRISKGAVLSIEEGVTFKNVKNDKVTIILESGAKVIASGSYENPITAITDNKEEKAFIVMKSSKLEYDNNLVDNYYYYKSIENPTVLMSKGSTENTVISSVDSDF